MQQIDYANHTLLWYDYETFGLSPQKDRIAQFAAQRTDMDLRPLGEPINIFCQPAADYLPQPQACLLTGLTPQLCRQQGVSEKEFAERIFTHMTQPNTISVGYNSIRFDDEFSRFLFWRNLLDPYSREWQQGCGRWDLLDVVRLTYALRPQGIQWPLDKDNLVTFKLEKLTRANGLEHQQAHDALSDVYATIELAKLIKRHQAKLFDFALQLHKKRFVESQILEPNSNRPRAFVHVSRQFPREKGCLAVMYPLSNNPFNNNEVICWNLASDPSELALLSAEQIKQRLFSKTAELPPGVERLALKGVHLNKSPMVVGNLKVLTPAVLQRWQIDKQQLEQNLVKIKSLPDMSAIWQQVYAKETDTAEVKEVEASLYDGFLPPEDKKRLEQLRQLSPAELAASKPDFIDERLAELLFHYRARNYTPTLDATEKEHWQQYCAAKLLGGAFGALTVEQFSEQLDALQQKLDEALEAGSIDDGFYQQHQEILELLYDWCAQLVEQLEV